MKLPQRVNLCEVGTRDGLQIEERFVPTDEKVMLVNALSACGVPRIQVTSFVHPKAVPQLADAEQVMARIERRPGTVYSALVPNDRGAFRAVDAGVDEIDLVVSASESHNLANVNMTVEESLDRMSTVAEVAARAGRPVVGGISTAFGCPFEGDVPLKRVEQIVARFVDLGVRAVNLADTTGMANPAQVLRTFAQLIPRWPRMEWHLHTHDTRGMAIANILAAMEAGVTHFDSSIGGVGGCPFAPGASGNVCSEDLVHCLHAMGTETGIDLEAMLGAARGLQAMLGHPLPGQVLKAGPSTRRYPVPEQVKARLQTA